MTQRHVRRGGGVGVKNKRRAGYMNRSEVLVISLVNVPLLSAVAL